MKKLTFYICCMLLNVTLYSQFIQVPDEVTKLNGNMVDKEQARSVAKHFLTERIVNQQLLKSADVLYFQYEWKNRKTRYIPKPKPD